MTRTEIRHIFALGSIFAFRMLGLFMVLPVFSLYAQHLNHASPWLIGLALGGYGLTQALCQLPFGAWSDFTTRKKVIAIGLSIFALGSVVAGFSHSIYGLIVGRALQGVGAVGSTIIALAADLSQPQDRPKAMGIMGATIGGSFTLALILGPVLTRWLTVADLFLLTGGLTLVSLLILWKAVPTVSPVAKAQSFGHVWQQLPSLWRYPALWRLNASIFLSHAILTALFMALPIVLQQGLHLNSQEQWRVYLPVFLFAAVAIGGVLRRLRQTQQQARYFKYCVAGITLSLLGFAGLPSSLIGLSSCLWLFFMAFTLLEALLPSMVSSLAPQDLRGTALGFYSTCQFLGIFVGGCLGGWLWQHYSTPGIFISLLMLSGLWLILSWPKFELE